MSGGAFDEAKGFSYIFNRAGTHSGHRTYTQEAEKEIKEGHFLYGKKLYSVFKRKDNNDAIFVTGNNGKDLYIILHLTYEENQDVNYPKYELLDSIYEVKEYLVKQYEKKINC